MNAGLILGMCLLTLHAGAPEPYPMARREFRLPVRQRPENLANLKELILFVSRDNGSSWEKQWAIAPREQAFFLFRAPEDGLYCFAIQTHDKNDNYQPSDMLNAPVGERVLVDTRHPVVSLNGNRQGDGIAVSWTIEEEHPDPRTLALEYRIDNGSWTQAPVAVTYQEQGSTYFPVPAPGAVSVRLRLADVAGNVGDAQVLIAAALRTAPATIPGGDQITRTSANVPASLSTPVVPAPVVPANLTPPAPAPVPPSELPGRGNLPTKKPSTATPMDRQAFPGTAASTPPGVVAGGSGEGRSGGGEQRAPRSFDPPNPVPPMNSVALNGGRRGALPELRIINRTAAQLDFEVGQCGPSGIGGVDVYMTRDEGMTWEQTRDFQPSLPAPGDERGPEQLRGSVLVPLPREDVVYGFYLVVKNGAGLGQRPPRNGDTPQVRLERDTHLPEATLYSPLADPDRPDNLLLAWKAKDRNLTATAITLLWARDPNESWQLIGEPELTNNGRPLHGGPNPKQFEVTGHYSWRLPPNMPPRVYLRMLVRDSAGNVRIIQTNEPILVDVTPPVLTSVRVSLSGN